MSGGRCPSRHLKIDIDFETKSRSVIKQYIEDIYGERMVCSVGAYDTYKIRGGLKDLIRMYGGKDVNYDKINSLTTFIKLPEGKDGNWEELFFAIRDNQQFKDIIRKNPEIVDLLYKILRLPKTKSVHPSATIILPKYGNDDIYDWIPLRRYKNILVSEWEGEFIEKVGFLKEDILGLSQLDKFTFCLNLIEETTGKRPDIYNIPINEEGVMDLFREGETGDVFQFHTDGLTNFCKEVKPDNVNELINMVALYRPGPIQSGAHHSYVKFKFKDKEPVFDFKLKEVTLDTYGLYIFQEQVMKACQVLGGFSSAETDDVRRAMGKKKAEVLEPYKNRFLDNAIKEGCSIKEANEIWAKLEMFSGYGFNKSHAAAYSLMGYNSQWLKYHYPVQFWTTAFEFASGETESRDIARYISEIRRTNDWIKISPPDINKANFSFQCDIEKGKIYWSFDKIKYSGEIRIDAILNERANGKFYSLSEFAIRLSKGVQKGTITNLIVSGCFDEIEEIDNVRDRYKVIKKYWTDNNYNLKECKVLDSPHIGKEWYWLLKQKEASKFATFDFKRYLRDTSIATEANKYIEPETVQSRRVIDKEVVLGGIVKKVTPRSSKNGPWTLLIIESNDNEISVNVWGDATKTYATKLEKHIDKIILFTGVVKEWNGRNSVHMTEEHKIHFLGEE